MNQAISQNAEFMNSSLASINASMSSNAQQMASSVEQMGNRIVSLEEKTQGKFPKFSVLHLSLFNFMFHLGFMHVLKLSPFCFPEIAQKEGGVKDKDGIAPTLEFMKDYFPEIIGYPEANADDYPTKALSPFINIDLEVQGSWLQKPLPESNSSDKVGVFSSNQNLPTSDKYFTPAAGDNEATKSSLDHKIPARIRDDDLRTFLNSKTLVQNNKITLPTYVFDPPTINVDSKYIKFNVIDSLARKATLENALCSQVINADKNGLYNILSSWDQEDETGVKLGESLTPNDMYNEFCAMYESLKIANKAQNRNKHLVLSIFSTNKINGRQYVLDQCSGSKTTKDIMKNTNLDSPNLFGTPPESLLSKMNNSMTDKPSPFVLKPGGKSAFKSSTQSTTRAPVKRALPYSYVNQPKRFKSAPSLPVQTPNSSKKGRFFRNQGPRKFQKTSSRRGGKN